MDIEAPAVPQIPIAGGGRFPVGRIFCVGRNYAEHAREMGDASPEPPFFFTKQPTAIPAICGTMPYPPRTADMHHEVELVVALGLGGSDISVDDAERHVFGYAVGLDMTRRDLQSAAKGKGRPWDMAKSFDSAAPIGTITRAGDAGDMNNVAITLTVNDQLRQTGRTSDMLWSISAIIAELSTYVRLLPGDLIFTGTPAGVGGVAPGDILKARIDGLVPLDVQIA